MKRWYLCKHSVNASPDLDNPLRDRVGCVGSDYYMAISSSIRSCLRSGGHLQPQRWARTGYLAGWQVAFHRGDDSHWSDPDLLVDTMIPEGFRTQPL